MTPDETAKALRELRDAVAEAMREIYRAAADGDSGDVACIAMKNLGRLLPEDMRPDPEDDHDEM